LSTIDPAITATVETFHSSTAGSSSGDWLFRLSSTGLPTGN